MRYSRVFPELAARDHRRELAIGRGHDPHVHFAAGAGAQHLEGPVLQHPQHLDLRGRIEIADLVEEDRAAVRDVEASLAIGTRVGEGAAHVAEHLALEQRRGYAAEIDLDERLRGPAAVAVDRLGDQLLAGAALTGNQDGGVGRCDPADEFEDAEHPRVASDQVAEIVARVEVVAGEHAIPLIRTRLDQPQRSLHGVQQLLVGPGLGDEVGRPGLHPFDRERDRAPRGDQDDGDCRRQLFDLLEQREAFLAGCPAGKVHVLDHELTRLAAEHRERLLGRAGRDRGQPGLLEQQRQGSRHRPVVVDDENHGTVRSKRSAGTPGVGVTAGVVPSAICHPARPGGPAHS